MTIPNKRRVLLVGAAGMLGGATVEAVLGRSELSLRVPTRRPGAQCESERTCCVP